MAASPSRRGAQGDLSELISLFFAMGRIMKERVHRAGSPFKASLLHFEALRYVAEKKNPLMRDVAKNFRVTPPAATLLIDGLVKERLLMRTFDALDRRAVRVKLTPKGSRFLKDSMDKRMDEFRKIFKVLDENERGELGAILKKIIKHNSAGSGK